MLSYRTIESHTLELLKALQSNEALKQTRGTKKDFIDIHELLKRFTLKEILDFYVQKYPENSLFRALLSLSYFEDADTQPMPTMFVNEDWDAIKTHIKEHIQGYQA